MDDSALKNTTDSLAALTGIFETHADPYRAHEQAKVLLMGLAKAPWFFRAVLRQHLSVAATFNQRRKNPVVEFIIENNEHYTLIANCFLPRDDRDTQLSHQSVHHHGSLILTTAAMFGPGYETWNFTKPDPIPSRDLMYRMGVTFAGRHRGGNVLFVDAYYPHIVFYPEDLSITLALWSNRSPVSWKTRLKRNPFLQRIKKPLKTVGQRLGLASALELNLVTMMDYYPAEGAFKALPQRSMYPMGSNDNFLHNMFYIVQKTGNADLADLVEDTVKRSGEEIGGKLLVAEYGSKLRAGIAIEPRFEEIHKFLPYANLTRQVVKGSLSCWTAA